MRAVGVEAKLSQPLKLTAIQLPFEETFRKTPSLYFSPVNVGSRVRHGYLDQELGDVPVGSAPFYFEGSNKDKTFDPNDYFGDGKNTSNRATFSMCELDLTDIPASEQVILDIEYTALTQDESDYIKTYILEDFIEGGSHRDQLDEATKERIDTAYKEMNEHVGLKWD